jgi:fructuronate reductase
VVTALQRQRPAPPVRIVHLGLGAFHRAHQAWYTQQTPGWGIAAFTGHSAALARELTAQDNLYHLVIRDNEGDRAEVIASIAETYPGTDLAGWKAAVAAPSTSLITLTVTESAYGYSGSGHLDTEHSDVAADLETCRLGGDSYRSIPGRLVAGLAARRAAEGGPLAIVPCDNVSDNAGVVQTVVNGFAQLVDPGLETWITEHVSFVSTMVDRITPATTADLVTTVAELTGFADSCPVATEPFTEWVLAGTFPAGRPDWQAAGARFVDDVAPFERRKLRFLNGAHSLFAYAGTGIGHRTVADAVADARCRTWLLDWWTFAAPTIRVAGDELNAYQEDLLARFGNARIAHFLEQIAIDGSQKIAIRVLPVLRERLAEDRRPDLGAAARIIGAWIAHLRGGVAVQDKNAATLRPAAAGRWESAVPSVLRLIGPDLAEDAELCAAIATFGRDFEAAIGSA